MEIELIEPDETLEPTPNLPATVEERAGLALASTKTEADLLALVEKAKAITLVNSPDGRDECHSQLMVLVRSRTTITKAAKDARDDATKFNKAVIKEEARLIAITAAEEARLQTLRDDWDKKVAAEKEAKAAAERARVLAITNRIAEINGYANLAGQCRTSTKIQELIDKLGAVELTGFDEFEQEAKDARALTMEAMERYLDVKKADEAERARVKAEQEAEEKRQREQAEALARQQAELDAQRAALQAQADAQAAEAKRLQDEREAQAAEAERLAVAAVMLSTALDEPDPTPTVEEPATPTLNEAAVLPTAQQEAIEDAIDAAPGDVVGVIAAKEVIEIAQANPVDLRPTNVVTLPRKTARPTDADLIGTLAMSFSVHESTVVAWLLDMDLNAYSATLLDEFTTKEKA